MAKKTYRTYYLKSLNLHLVGEDGNRIVVQFRGGIQVDSTAKYTTRNEFIQGLLENCAGFNRDYYIESVQDDDAPVAEPAPEKKEKKAEEKPVLPEVKGSERFLNLVEMKNRMAELGIELPEDANYQKAKAVANAAGYDFQIKKK